jgi:hypothetical protein
MTRTPPFLSVVGDHDEGGPALVLTVTTEALIVCAQCPHLHVRVLDVVATPDALRRLATSLRQWAKQLESVA